MNLRTLTALLVISRLSRKVAAVRSDACWDGTNAVDYTGTIAVTSTGRTCQNWVDDSPHTHTFHGSAVFPYDGDDVAASNYCRDPDGSSVNLGPWCFTMDPLVRYEFCDIPLCYNFPCTGSEIAGQSDPSSFTTFLDSYTSINYLQKEDTPYSYTCCGTVKQWRVYIRNSGTIRFQVWRKDSVTGNYILRGENVYTYAPGDANTRHDETVPQNERIPVQEADLIGWYTDGLDMVSFSTGTSKQTALLGMSAPSVGDSVDFSAAAIGNSRDYAIGAEVTASLAPYFDNTVPSISVTVSEAVGNTVHTLTVADDDVDDINNLTISMATNTYFDISGSDLIVKSSLVIGTEILQLFVTDRCSQTGTSTLTVTITPDVVSITSLPATVHVSESITVETLLHTLIMSPPVTYVCSLDSYEPIRTEGNPFITKTNATSGDIGVYLKDSADIRYNVTTSYNVTVTCTNADPSSDTSYLIVNIDPNIAPVFTNFNSSLTIDAALTSINDVVYRATVTDGDPVTLSLITDPSPAPFLISNNGDITITGDPVLESQTSYTFIITADDGFSTVTSSNISVSIINTNQKPVITNLPAPTQTALENQAVGTTVYTVLQSDANGDTPTFLATYSSVQCAGMYAINSSSGSVTTLAALDFETDTSCTLTITVTDGLYTSDPGTLVIDVGDEDEPPIFTSSAYVITTDEVPDGTVLPSAGISATDPEGTAVSFSLDCAYVDINSASGIVTMTTAYDIDTSSTSPFTISCNVMATDATSQVATATLDVIVSDANDIAPVFATAAYTSYIAQGYNRYGIIDKVMATDGDKTSPNNAVTYTITPSTTFDIGSDSGEIRNIVDLSGVPAGTTYTLTVTATDGGTPPLSDTATVVVSVLSETTTTTVPTTTSGEEGFFQDTGNIVLLALIVLALLLLAAVLAFLLCKFCCKKNFLTSRSHVTRVRPDHQKFPLEDNGGRENGEQQASDSSKISKAQTSPLVQCEHLTPQQKPTWGRSPRASPVGSERPDSVLSYISVESIPNRVSAVQSVRRTDWLSHGIESPTSVSKVPLHIRGKQTSCS